MPRKLRRQDLPQEHPRGLMWIRSKRKWVTPEERQRIAREEFEHNGIPFHGDPSYWWAEQAKRKKLIARAIDAICAAPNDQDWQSSVDMLVQQDIRHLNKTMKFSESTPIGRCIAIVTDRRGQLWLAVAVGYAARYAPMDLTP